MKTVEPALYEIRIKARLTAQRAAWFEGLTLTVEDNGETLLRGFFKGPGCAVRGAGQNPRSRAAVVESRVFIGSVAHRTRTKT